jgi:hypothetical protein
VKLALYISAAAIAVLAATSALQGRQASTAALAIACAVNVLAAARWRVVA